MRTYRADALASATAGAVAYAISQPAEVDVNSTRRTLHPNYRDQIEEMYDES